jgi:hypothetical protein
MWLANIQINPEYEKMGMCTMQEQEKKGHFEADWYIV